MPGLAPDPSGARRRNKRPLFTQLPAAGFDGEVPPWPLGRDVGLEAKRDIAAGNVARLERELEGLDDPRRAGGVKKNLADWREKLALFEIQLREQAGLEGEVWAALWRTPMAAEWVKLGWSRSVASYVRHQILGELGSMDDAKLAQSWADRLGLTPVSLLRLRWEVDAPSERAASDGRTVARRKGLRLVLPDADEQSA